MPSLMQSMNTEKSTTLNHVLPPHTHSHSQTQTPSQLPRGWVRVSVSLSEEQCTDDVIGIRWWGADAVESSSYVGTHVVSSVIRTSRALFVQWLRDAPGRQALEVFVRRGNRIWSGCVPLASVIDRLAAGGENHTVSQRHVRVELLERREGREGRAMASKMVCMCHIDVSFDERRVAEGPEYPPYAVCGEDVERLVSEKLSLSAETPSPMASSSGKERLDDEGCGEPGWPEGARRLDVDLCCVWFDPVHAPLNKSGGPCDVYITLGMSKKDEQRVTKSARVSRNDDSMMMYAEWKEENVSFEMEEEAGGGTLSGASPRSPIVTVGLWRSVRVVDQFHNFANSAQNVLSSSLGCHLVSPFDELIGSAVVVPTGALADEDGVEVPLYDSELKKSGMVRLKMKVICESGSLNTDDVVVVDERSALNYELLGNMDALARHVLPEKGDESEEVLKERQRRLLISDSDDDGGGDFVGVAYEGAVSDTEEHGQNHGRRDVGQRHCYNEDMQRPAISDDWMFSIDKNNNESSI